MGTVFSDEGDDYTKPVTRPTSAAPAPPSNAVGSHVVHKPPALVRLERDKNIEDRPMLQVPHTEVRLLYVERERRSDVVGPHGYLAIALDKKVQEQQLREAAEANDVPLKRGREESDGSTGPFATHATKALMAGPREDEYAVSKTLHDIMTDPNPVAAAALEYNEEEHLELQDYIREWKAAFKQANQRYPTRKDISRDPEILAKHERSRDLEAMRKLLDEQELAHMKKGIDDLIEIEGVERKNKALAQKQREEEEAAEKAKEEADFAKLTKYEESAAMDLDNFEYALLRDMIKQWKRSFKEENGRKPTKKDLEADPQMSDAYVKVQSFEAFQRSRGSFAGQKKEGSELGESAIQIASLRRDTNAEEEEGEDQQEGDGAGRKTRVSMTSPAAERKGSNAVRGWIPTSFSPSPQERAENEAYPFSQKFVFPKGRSMQDRVFFTVDGNFDLGHSVMSMTHKDYELEEDEIFEMAGVHRPALPPRDIKQKDPLASYELQSNLLDALRIAIEAPIESFRDGTADSALEEFRQQALSEAQHLFDNARHEDAAFAATAGSATANQTLLLRMGTKLKTSLLQGGESTFSRAGSSALSRIGSASSSRQLGGGRRGWNDVASNRSVSPAVSLGDGVAEGTVVSQTFERGPGELHTSNSGAQQGADDEGGPPLESVRRVSEDYLPGPRRGSEEQNPEEEKVVMVRERKRLHRILNEYKEQYLQANGVPPDGFTMAQDPQIRDVFSAYTELKRLTKKKKDDAAGADDDAQPTHGDTSALHEEEQPPQAAPEPAAPPATYVPQRDIVSIIESASPQRAQLKAIASEPSPEELELKQLQKEVKLWKRGFKEREGRNPTRRDLKEHPDICDKYNRLKELEGGGDGGHGHDEEAAAQQSAMFAQMSPEEIAEHFSSLLMQEEQTEEVDRRDIEADETIAFRQICNAAGKSRKQSFAYAADRSAGDAMLTAKKLSQYSSMKNSQLTNSSAGEEAAVEAPEAASGAHAPETLVIEDHEGEEPTVVLAPKPSRHGADSGWNSPGLGDDDDDTKIGRRKSLAKDLNDWKKSFHDLHGRAPTTHDMKQDPEAMNKYKEYEALPRDGAESALSYEKQQANLVVTEQALGRQLQEWRLEFARFHGREATIKDLSDDAAMLALYERYIAARESQEPDPSDYIGLSLKRKQLGKALNEWKRDFAMRVGRNPTAKDIKADSTVSVMFERYQAIPKDVDELALQQLNNAAHWEASAEDTEQQRRKEMKRRKKDLSRLLNEWKHEFELVNARKPKVADIMADPMVQTVYTEFQALEKELAAGDADGTHNMSLGGTGGAPARKSWMDAGGAGADEGDQHHPDDANEQQQPEQERAETPLPKRKKRLAKQLNAWKAAFKEREGKNPSKSDIMNAPEVAEIYTQYQDLRKRLKSTADGGGEDDDEQPTQGHDTSAANESMGDQQQHMSTSPARQAQDQSGEIELSPAQGAGPSEGLDSSDIQPMSLEALHELPPTALKQRKKDISKKLNQWKEQFAERNNGKAPKTSDIRKDAAALRLFEELQEIKTLLSAQEEAQNASSSAANASVVEDI